MKHISLALFLCGMILMNTSCDDYADTYPQEYEKMLLLQTYGEQAIELVNTGEPTNYTITVMKSGSQPTLDAVAHIGTMDKAAFDEYISERGRDYVAMPANCYSFDMEDLAYCCSETYKIINLELNTGEINKEIKKLGAGETLVLPISLTSAVDSVLESKNTLILIPSVLTPTISFTESSTETLTKYLPSSGGSVDLGLGLQVDNKWEFTCKVAIDEETTTLKGATLESENITFAPGSNPHVTVNIPKFTQSVGNVGVKIVDIVGKDGFEFDKDPFILTASIEKYDLTVDMLSTNALEPYEGSLANLLDGDVGTYFHTAWSWDVGSKHYFQVNLPELTKSFHFSYTNRGDNGNAALLKFNLYTGTDENNLQLYKQYDSDADKLPLGAKGVFESSDVTVDNAANILRFECEQSKGGAFFVWSEFSLYIVPE